MKISIITVCYNSEKTIERTIKSVLEQNYKNIEYIIKDGKSKDNTLAIIKRYEKKFNGKLKIKSCTDKGIYDAMNQAIELCTGDIIGLINSDDVLAHKNIIKNIANTFKIQNCDAIYGDLVFMDAETMTIPKRNFIAHKDSKLLGWQMPHPTLYLKKRIYMEIGKFNTNYKIAADLDFMYRLLYSNEYKIYYIKKYLVKMSAGGVSTNGLKGYINNLKESITVSKLNHIPFPYLSNFYRIFKTIFQAINAKFKKKKIVKRLEKEKMEMLDF